MRFLIVGAGGIGAYYAARLLHAGHTLVLVARGAHLQAMQQNGLQVEHESLSFQGKVDACSEETLRQNYACADFDLILLCFKSYDTQAWLETHQDWLKQGTTPILSLQNGVDNEPLLAAALGVPRVLGGLAVRIGGHIIEPGRIEARGPAQIVLGSWPNHAESSEQEGFLKHLVEVFNQAQIPTQLAADIRYELWRKLIINNGVNPLSALTRLDTGALTRDPYYRQAVYQAMQEVAQVAPAEGVVLQTQDVEEMFKLICEFDPIKTSMLVDQEKGRPLELEAISGSVLQRAQRLGVHTPITALIYALLKAHQKI
ncbi:ketopantoate reductase family protein [Nitrincola tapanii]|uniref:2-dehydropantoate 2-reductase n=1 Tax=Nitrincola tapanii TaxID=1708751 RepID=A0A5A9W1X4_9GAMM|nr:2-dehydropantoate 2-reductase [Nitrincola tapanii]KAA0873551.1 2-dehydropantoate 2-reductase [Nitrincola tapanii]